MAVDPKNGLVFIDEFGRVEISGHDELLESIYGGNGSETSKHHEAHSHDVSCGIDWACSDKSCSDAGCKPKHH